MSQALTIQTIEAELENITPQITTMLPPDVPLDRFKAVMLAAIRQKPDLMRHPQSLFNACLNAAQDGLLPDGREGAIVPRKGVAVWQPMIQGIIKRVKTSGSVVSLSANVVYDGEDFSVMLGDEDRIVHRRDVSRVAPGHEVAVYAIAKLKDGSAEREVMTWEQVMTVRQASAMPNSGPWTDWPDEMARKTVVRRLAKRLPVLEQGDEALQRTIGRVDQLYDFGNQRTEAPSPPPDGARVMASLKAAAAPTPRPARKVAPPLPDDWGALRNQGRPDDPYAPTESAHDRKVAEEPPRPRTRKDYLDGLEIALRDARSPEEVDRIVCGEEAMRAKETFQNGHKQRLETLISETLAKWWHTPPDAETPDDGELEIVGADKLAAG